MPSPSAPVMVFSVTAVTPTGPSVAAPTEIPSFPALVTTLRVTRLSRVG